MAPSSVPSSGQPGSVPGQPPGAGQSGPTNPPGNGGFVPDASPGTSGPTLPDATPAGANPTAVPLGAVSLTGAGSGPGTATNPFAVVPTTSDISLWPLILVAGLAVQVAIAIRATNRRRLSWANIPFDRWMARISDLVGPPDKASPR